MARPILEPDTAELQQALNSSRRRSVDLLVLAIRHGRLKSVCNNCEKQVQESQDNLLRAEMMKVRRHCTALSWVPG